MSSLRQPTLSLFFCLLVLIFEERDKHIHHKFGTRRIFSKTERSKLIEDFVLKTDRPTRLGIEAPSPIYKMMVKK